MMNLSRASRNRATLTCGAIYAKLWQLGFRLQKKITFILKRFQAIHRIRFGENKLIVP